MGFNSAFKGLKVQVVFSPVRLSPGRSKTGTCEREVGHPGKCPGHQPISGAKTSLE